MGWCAETRACLLAARAILDQLATDPDIDTLISHLKKVVKSAQDLGVSNITEILLTFKGDRLDMNDVAPYTDAEFKHVKRESSRLSERAQNLSALRSPQ
jgi:hypothetical protein